MRAARFGPALALAVLVTSTGSIARSDPAPTGLTVLVLGTSVRLSWTAPDPGSGNTRVKLLRRLNAPPAGPDDPSADVLFADSGTYYEHPIADLLPDVSGSPHVYHYAAYGCDASGAVCESGGSQATFAPTLTQCLRGGGYAIYWRHADADICTDHLELGQADTTHVPDWWRSCDANCPTTTARQMNAAGVQHATYIGDQIRALGIPTGRVISSEYCRCLGTAQLMNLGPTIELNPGITYYVHDELNRCTNCYELIGEAPAPGTNTAIIGHAGFSTSCATLGALAWGECAVFKPNGLGGAALVTRLTWDAWGPLTTDVAPVAAPPHRVGVEAFEMAEGVRIRYRIGQRSVPVRFEIFDVRGRRVWNSQTESQREGSYERTWDKRDLHGRQVSRGVYFVRLSAGPAIGICKVAILGR